MAGWQAIEPIPIVTVGRRAQGPLERLAPRDYVGLSLFNEGNGRQSPQFMQLLGHAVRRPSPEELETAGIRSSTMPVWPAQGSVVFEDGLAIVKFAEP